MWDVLGQASDNNIIYTGAGILGGGGAMVVVIKYLIKREIEAALNHIHNNKIHIDERNGYVRESFCKLQHDNTNAALAEIKNDVREIRRILETKE